MNSKVSSSETCERVPIFMNHVDDSPFRVADESCNTSIKDEPLDITECSLKDFKSELEVFDVNIKEEPCLEDTNSASDSLEINVSNIIEKRTSSNIEKSLNSITSNKMPVTRKLIVNKQEKTPILSKNPSLKDTVMDSVQRAQETIKDAPSLNKEVLNKTVTNFMVTSPDKSHLIDHTYSLSRNTESFTVTCSRCFSIVDRENFRQHIKSCFLRKTFFNKVSSDKANEHKITSSNLKSGRCLRFINNNHSSNSNFRNKSHTNDNNLRNIGRKADLSLSLYNEQLQKNYGKKNFFSAELSSKTKKGHGRHSCNICSYVTISLVSLRNHKTCHIKKMPIIQCDKCAFRSTKRALEVHKKTHTSVADPHANSSKTLMVVKTGRHRKLEKRTLCCAICRFTTDKQQILKDHERRHRRTHLRIVQCFYCGQRYTRYMLYLHIKNIHPGERFLIDYQYRDKVQTESSLKGSISSFPTTEENSVEKHVEKYDAQKSPQCKGTQNCSICSFSTNDKVTLRLHLRKHQFEPIKRKTELGRKFYDCRMCSYGRPTLDSINSHIDLHRKNLPIRKCPKCDFRSTRQALRYHMQKCKYKNTQKSTDKSEREISEVKASQSTVEFSESDKMSEKCAFCSFLTRDKLKLQLHVKEEHFYELIKDRSGVLMYRCKLCSYRNREFTSMITHTNRHKSTVPIVKCPDCDFKSIPKVLISHWRKCKLKNKKVHSEENNLFEPVKGTDSLGHQRFYCKLCSYDSNRLRNIIPHIKSHKRNILLVSCSYCDFKSTLKAVKFHQKKCKFVNVEANEDILEKA